MSLYKGMMQPLIAAVPINVLAFTTTEIVKTRLKNDKPNMTPFR